MWAPERERPVLLTGMEPPQFVLDSDLATKKLDRRAVSDLLDNRLSNGSWGALVLDITAY